MKTARLKCLLLLLLIPFAMFAQNTVQGTVVYGDGEPIIGAAVQVKGTTVGTITDFDGNFSLSASSDATLVVS